MSKSIVAYKAATLMFLEARASGHTQTEYNIARELLGGLWDRLTPVERQQINDWARTVTKAPIEVTLQ